jgi:hypothetical protein
MYPIFSSSAPDAVRTGIYSEFDGFALPDGDPDTENPDNPKGLQLVVYYEYLQCTYSTQPTSADADCISIAMVHIREYKSTFYVAERVTTARMDGAIATRQLIQSSARSYKSLHLCPQTRMDHLVKHTD